MTRPSLTPSDAVAINAVLAAVRQAADVVCDRWSLALILAAFLGETRFGGFMTRTGMANRLVTARLRSLEAEGLLVRLPYSRRPLRHEYRLTNMGEAFFEVVAQMARWRRIWRPAEDDPIAALVAARAEGPIDGPLICGACGAAVTARDIELRLNRAQLQTMPAKQTAHRRSTQAGAPSPGAQDLLGPCLDVFGDKWGIEIIICAFMRLRRFGDFRAQTGIAASILTDRLARLTEAGVLERVDGGYRLTPCGVDVYGVLIAIQDWADTWLAVRYRSPVRLIHRACGQVFHLPPARPNRA
ncbi:helix-turn-helix domain-containing protein [Phenylobacterium aquaticum]|uniref:winged helix-turn-helix transcriptional regulator n=1 Tax=Phenylobacterium aquaticum TaxID=1763816 RepID=UPI0026EAEF1B|nr:helix-turn-helix domain-containing protein [Phenylobacterium aquaticum]